MSLQIALVSPDKVFSDHYARVFAGQGLQLQVVQPERFNLDVFQSIRPLALLVEMQNDAQLETIFAMRCREHLRKIPVIALLESTSKEMVVKVHRAGIKDILAKQAEEQQIVDRVLKYCQTHVNSVQETTSPKERIENELQWGDPATTAFKKHIQREVHKRLEMLPSLPMVVMEIMKLVENEKSSAGDFEEHISHDPALAARILRIANSSFFGQSRQIKSIRDAIVVLGYRTLKSVVMAASTGAILNRPAEGYGLVSGGLWKHSIACAVGSRLMAVKIGRNAAEAEELFVQGLLHDIGKILLNSFLNEKADQFQMAVSEETINLMEAELMIMGTDHCRVGVKIAERWNLPLEVRHAIQYHHNPKTATEFQDQVTLVHSINYLCYDLKIGLRPDTHVSVPFDAETAVKIGITEDLMKEMQDEFMAQLEELEKLFAMIGV